MFKYRNSYVIAANSFRNSIFVIKFAHNKNLKDKLRICQVYKSEAPVDNKDLCVMQIPNMPWKFAVPTYLLSKSKFGNELAVFANWIAYLMSLPHQDPGRSPICLSGKTPKIGPKIPYNLWLKSAEIPYSGQASDHVINKAWHLTQKKFIRCVATKNVCKLHGIQD